MISRRFMHVAEATKNAILMVVKKTTVIEIGE